MSIQSEIDRLNAAKADIQSALVEGGQTVESTDTLTDYAGKIRALSSGFAEQIAYHNEDSEAHSDIRGAIPTKTSDLTNDSGFITEYTETDPTVPAWAKEPTKPSYTANEVGADASGSAAAALANAKTYADSAAGTAESNANSYTDTQIAAIPTPDVSGQIDTHNTDTSAHSDIRSAIPTKTSDLTNDSGFITSEAIEGSGIEIGPDEPTDTDVWIDTDETSAAARIVASFKGRSGAVMPQSGDYTYDMVGAAPAPLSGHLTLYVATTGSDTAGDGSSANPYATIQYALNTLPKDLGTYYVTINVAAGEYAGFTVASFINGYQNKPGISIVGESRDTVTITGPAYVNSCSAYISLQALHFTDLVSSLSNRYFCMTGCLIDGTDTVNGLRIDATSTVKVFNTIINDKTGYAIRVDESMAFLNYVSGENNTVGVESGSDSSAMPGLVIIGNSFTLSATTQYVKSRGGIIIKGDAFV